VQPGITTTGVGEEPIDNLPAPLGYRGVVGGYAELFVSASDGLRLFAREYGPRGSAALPVVCLPGLARTSADFHALALALSRDERLPRRVLALDYRGRGRSDHDPNSRNYDIRVELNDVLHVAAVAGIERALFVGTSRGGIIAMGLAAARPTLLGGAILNDIGPVIEREGLARIRGYIGKLPEPADYAEAVEILKDLMGPQFPAATEDDWQDYARGTWVEADGRLRLAYDPALMKPLESIDLDGPLPQLWPYFEGLKRVPVLALRGQNSDLFSTETLAAMSKAHPNLEAVTVPGQGHAPLLRDREHIDRIKEFVARVESGLP
jgi:pimeloyl-ACP methyl ester carboxylesterase